MSVRSIFGGTLVVAGTANQDGQFELEGEVPDGLAPGEPGIEVICGDQVATQEFTVVVVGPPLVLTVPPVARPPVANPEFLG